MRHDVGEEHQRLHSVAGPRAFARYSDLCIGRHIQRSQAVSVVLEVRGDRPFRATSGSDGSLRSGGLIATAPSASGLAFRSDCMGARTEARTTGACTAWRIDGQCKRRASRVAPGYFVMAVDFLEWQYARHLRYNFVGEALRMTAITSEAR